MSYTDALWALQQIAQGRVLDHHRLSAGVEALEDGIRKGADEPAWCQAAAELPGLGATPNKFAVRRRAAQLADEFGRLVDIWETDV